MKILSYQYHHQQVILTPVCHEGFQNTEPILTEAHFATPEHCKMIQSAWLLACGFVRAGHGRMLVTYYTGPVVEERLTRAKNNNSNHLMPSFRNRNRLPGYANEQANGSFIGQYFFGSTCGSWICSKGFHSIDYAGLTCAGSDRGYDGR